MRYIIRNGFAFALAASMFANASAEQCPVEKFTVKDIERLKFSEALVIAIVDNMESSHFEEKDRSFDSSFLVKGTPVKLNYKDMKSLSDYVKRNSSFTFTRDQQVDYLRTNVSLVSAEMYDQCLKRRTDNFRIEIPQSAYTEDAFLIQIIWTPTYSIADKKGAPAVAEIEVLNGLVDGKDIASKKVADKKVAKFKITRTGSTSKTLNIIPTVDDYGNGEDVAILVPPILPPKYTTRLRQWPEEGVRFEPFCTDDGGGMCGNAAKSFRSCLPASDDGLLLPSSLAIEFKGSNVNVKESSANDGNKVCVDYGTPSGEFMGRGGYAALSDLTFSVREVVPIEAAKLKAPRATTQAVTLQTGEARR